MFFVPKKHAPAAVVRKHLSQKVVRDAFALTDLWDPDWSGFLRTQVASLGRNAFAEATRLLPDLSEEERLTWVFEACRDDPVAQAVWLLVVRTECPRLGGVADGMAERISTSGAVSLLLSGNASRLSSLAILYTGMQKQASKLIFNASVAGHLIEGDRRALSFIKKLNSLPQIDGSRARDCFDVAAARKESLSISMDRCRPEAVLCIQRSQVADALLKSALAGHLFEQENVKKQHLKGLSALLDGKVCNNLFSLLSGGDFPKLEAMITKAFGKVPENELPETVRQALHRCWLKKNPFLSDNVTGLSNDWAPMSAGLADWLRRWFDMEPAPWALGEENAMIELLGSERIVSNTSLTVMNRLHEAYGLRVLKALAVHANAQPLTETHPEAYADMSLEDAYRTVKSLKGFKTIVLPRLDREGFFRLLKLRVHRHCGWLSVYLSSREEPARTELKRGILAVMPPQAARRWVTVDDPVWLELGFEKLMQPEYKDVVKAQIDALASMEGSPYAFLGPLFELENARRMRVMRDGTDRAKLLGILMRHSVMRRRMVTDLLDERMVALRPKPRSAGNVAVILDSVAISVRKLAIDLLVSKTFCGSITLKNNIVCMAIEDCGSSSTARLRLLRLAMKAPGHLDVLTRPDLKWSRNELEAMASFMTDNYVDDYVGLAGDEGLERVFGLSPEAVSGRLRFRLCCRRASSGGRQPVRLKFYEPKDDDDRRHEAACEVFGMADGGVRRRTQTWLEKLGADVAAVLEIVRPVAQLLPEELRRLVGEAAARLAVAPEDRLNMLMKASEHDPLGWWPAEGPSGEDGLVYGVLRAHHSVVRAAEAWPEDESAARRALELMQTRWHTDAAWLEIALAIGLEHAPLLRDLIGRTDWKAAPGNRYDKCYARCRIPKKNGGEREIHAPSPTLKAVQALVNERILQPLGSHAAAWGFVPGRGIAGNAALHVGRPIVACVDIRSCFPSVGRRLVMHVLRRDLSDRFSDDAVMRIADIVLAEGVLPTGAPTSPALLNRVLFKTDEILTAAAAGRGCTYTRYADDLTFSGGEEAVALVGVARGVLRGIGLKLESRKTNVFRRGRRQCCTGLVVNDKVGVRRDYARCLRAAVHAVACGREPSLDGRPLTIMMLKGHVAFLESVKPEEGAALRKRLAAALSSAGERHE